jgi:dipeptidyl-peptidase-4
MKKSIVLFVGFTTLAITTLAQMPQNNLPRFVRWVDNNQLVVNTKLNGEKAAKEYAYNIVTKQYTVAPAAVASVEKSVSVKNANVYVKENGVETQLTFDAAEEKNPTLSPDGKYVGYTKNNIYIPFVLQIKKKLPSLTKRQRVF